MNELLLKLKACEPALIWAKDKSWEEVYKTCSRGDWLLWLFARTNPDNIKELTLAKGRCANTVIHLMKDQRSKDAVKAAIDFCNGLISREKLDKFAADAAHAVTAAAYAAAAELAAANAAVYAAEAELVAAAAAAAAARRNNQQETADLCRFYLPIKLWNI